MEIEKFEQAKKIKENLDKLERQKYFRGKDIIKEMVTKELERVTEEIELVKEEFENI